MTERQLKIICYFIWRAGGNRLHTFSEILKEAEWWVGNEN